MTEVLKAEGERSLALGNQRILFEVHPDGTTKSVHKQIGLIFTAGTFDTYGIAQVGDLIQANQPIRTPAYNVRQPELPAETLIQSIPVAAAKNAMNWPRRRSFRGIAAVLTVGDSQEVGLRANRWSTPRQLHRSPDAAVYYAHA
ncbi:MAG: hypothetical protein GDA68_19445 [Nitrospira sp. CR2.1]|nr:hypothetical protein [Nitrospira sp. CR2.1]